MTFTANLAGSTKPYLIRAIYDWCLDSGFTPYLQVRVDADTRVPAAYVKDGEIVLSLGVEAVHNLQISDEYIVFSARFGGVAQEVRAPVAAVLGIFSRETQQGLFFQLEVPAMAYERDVDAIPEGVGEDASISGSGDEAPQPPPKGGRPVLRRVK